jgi:hypothetical protein
MMSCQNVKVISRHFECRHDDEREEEEEEKSQ